MHGNQQNRVYCSGISHETYTAAGQAIFIPASVDEKVAVAAIKYLNWMCKPESLLIVSALFVFRV